ncbi:MAG: RNA methyltransferase [Planctomycetes bacterium]|nr:RNA methyltransferase [Planctomycetota bacterium]
MPVFRLDNLDDPRLDPYRSLKTTNMTRDHGLFIAEGKRVVERLFHSDFRVHSVLLSERREAEVRPWVPPDTPTYVLPHELARRLVGYNFHVGVLACGYRKRQPALPDAVQDVTAESLLVGCPDVTDPENLGTIIRLCAAFGVDALLLGRACCDPFSRRVLRVSMGNALFLPIVEAENLADVLQQYRCDRHYELVATVLDASAEPLETTSRSRRMILLFGNEATGLRHPYLELSDRRITIPMHGSIDSLNVAVAAGIFLYHFTRYASRSANGPTESAAEPPPAPN